VAVAVSLPGQYELRITLRDVDVLGSPATVSVLSQACRGNLVFALAAAGDRIALLRGSLIVGERADISCLSAPSFQPTWARSIADERISRLRATSDSLFADIGGGVFLRLSADGDVLERLPSSVPLRTVVQHATLGLCALTKARAVVVLAKAADGDGGVIFQLEAAADIAVLPSGDFVLVAPPRCVVVSPEGKEVRSWPLPKSALSAAALRLFAAGSCVLVLSVMMAGATELTLYRDDGTLARQWKVKDATGACMDHLGCVVVKTRSEIQVYK
jgi:hypothetical protein